MVQHRADSAIPVRLDLAELVREEMAGMLSSWHERDLQALDVGMDMPAMPCLVDGDATTLREAVKNVLGNALLYGAPGLLHVDIAAVGPHWEVRFIDDGPGIPEASQASLRTPFSPRSGNRAGGSLGLSIVEQVMAAHGGALLFSHDQGSHFAVVLQLKRASPAL